MPGFRACTIRQPVAVSSPGIGVMSPRRLHQLWTGDELMRNGGGTGPRIRTMGQAEQVGYRLLAFGAGMIGVGTLLSLTVVLIYLGAPLVLAGAMLVLGVILWMFAIS